MSTDSRRLSYIAEQRDIGWIAQDTGLGIAKLESLAETGAVLGRSDSLAIRRTYQTEAYDRMRTAGFSSTQAGRFKWFTPESVKERTEAVAQKVEYLSQGAFAALKANLDRAGESYNEEILKQQARGSVWEGFRHSLATYEEWMEYP